MQKILGMVLVLMSMNVAAAISQGVQGHASGDVVAVKTDSQVAAWCDFSKQIVVTQFNVLCVYNGSKVAVND